MKKKAPLTLEEYITEKEVSVMLNNCEEDKITDKLILCISWLVAPAPRYFYKLTPYNFKFDEVLGLMEVTIENRILIFKMPVENKNIFFEVLKRELGVLIQEGKGWDRILNWKPRYAKDQIRTTLGKLSKGLDRNNVELNHFKTTFLLQMIIGGASSIDICFWKGDYTLLGSQLDLKYKKVIFQNINEGKLENLGNSGGYYFRPTPTQVKIWRDTIKQTTKYKDQKAKIETPITIKEVLQNE